MEVVRVEWVRVLVLVVVLVAVPVDLFEIQKLNGTKDGRGQAGSAA